MLQHLLRGSGRNRLLTTRTMRRAERRVEHAQVIPQIGHSADSRTWVAPNRFLVNRNDRREAVNKVNVGFAQLVHKPLGVGGHRGQQPSLSLSVKSVECQ